MSDAMSEAIAAAPDPRAAKKARRRAAWARRRAAVPTDAERATLGAQVAQHGAALVAEHVVERSGGPGVVCSYVSWPSEPPTAALNDALMAAGHEVLVPITLPDLDLDWRPLTSADDPSSGLGHHVLPRVDVVLAPATLVDRAGTRLGQGGGCYDRTLPRLRPGTPVVAVLFDGELVDEPLPREEHDARVDAVLTPSGVTWLGA